MTYFIRKYVHKEKPLFNYKQLYKYKTRSGLILVYTEYHEMEIFGDIQIKR